MRKLDNLIKLNGSNTVKGFPEIYTSNNDSIKSVINDMVDDITTERTATRNTCIKLNTSINNLNSTVTALGNRIKLLENMINVSKGGNSDSDSDMDTLEITLGKYDETISYLMKKISILENEIQTLKNK